MSASALQLPETISGDTAAAIEFIGRYCQQTGMAAICLTAIIPDGPTETRTFDPSDRGALCQWIDERQGHKNLYFAANAVTGHLNKKPSKSDMAAAVALWTDLDPGGNAKHFTAERQRIDRETAALIFSPAPPTIVLDSGGGYQCFWLLKSPMPLDSETMATVEALGRRLELRFGADNIRNVDRIMRLPGTINVPGAKKLAKGRKPALACLLSFSDARYSLDEIRELTCWQLEGMNALTLEGETRSALLNVLRTDDKFYGRWCGDDTGLKHNSRSEFQFAIGGMWKGHGLPKEDLLTILEACPATNSEKLDDRQIDRIWDRTANQEGERAATRPQRDRILDLRRDVELWHDPSKSGFATICRDGHSEHHRVQSKAFRGWLVAEFMARGGAAPSSTAIGEALNGFEAYAYQGEERETRIRTAEHNGKIYLDIGRRAWDAIEVDAEGWRIVPRAPIPMLRPSGILALPEPVAGGKISELRKFVNLPRDDDFGLLVGWLLAALRPRGPYPILNPVGEGGSAKTTLSRLCRALTDPNVASVTSPPRNEVDLQVDAANGHLLAYDNISHVNSDTADALCRLATGAGLGRRQLYTDSDRHVLFACRPIILNGISDMAHRDDLSQRTISLFLPHIPDERRKSELDFQRDFDAAAPRILGALLDGVSHAIRHLPEVKAQPPRLADFTFWVMAAIGAYGWNAQAFLEIMHEYRATAAAKTAEADAIAKSVQALMSDRETWQGSLGELLSALDTVWTAFDAPSDRNWPTDVIRLSSRLRRSAPALRVLGIDVAIGDRAGHGNKRVVTIRRSAVESDSVRAAE